MQALFSDAAATASYVDALAIVEFVSTFGQLWEALPISLPELQQAVENPVDHPALGQLYNTLLSCVLLDQVHTLLSTIHMQFDVCEDLSCRQTDRQTDRQTPVCRHLGYSLLCLSDQVHTLRRAAAAAALPCWLPIAGSVPRQPASFQP